MIWHAFFSMAERISTYKACHIMPYTLIYVDINVIKRWYQRHNKNALYVDMTCLIRWYTLISTSYQRIRHVISTYKAFLPYINVYQRIRRWYTLISTSYQRHINVYQRIRHDMTCLIRWYQREKCRIRHVISTYKAFFIHCMRDFHDSLSWDFLNLSVCMYKALFRFVKVKFICLNLI